MFGNKSRYLNVAQYTITDRRGRTVNVVSVPPPPPFTLMGYHRLIQGQRIDHLAARYNNDSAGFWRIVEGNDAMLAEALTEKPIITIPNN